MELFTACKAAGARKARGILSLANISKAAIFEILDDLEIKPFRIKYYCERRDLGFDEKMRNLLAAGKRLSFNFDENAGLAPPGSGEPQTHALSHDEKPGIVAIGATTPDLPPTEENGVAMRDYEYTRFG